MKFSKICFPVCLLAFLISLNAPAAQAVLFTKAPQTPEKQTPQPVPHDVSPGDEKIIQDAETFKADTKPYHKTPYNDPNLEFDILLPKDWNIEPFVQAQNSTSLNQKIMEDVARFKSPMIGVTQAVVTIRSIHLGYEISAENWLKNFVLISGYSIQEKITSPNNKRASVSFVSTNEGRSAFTYATLQINGSVAMLAQFEIPLALRERLKFLQTNVIDSFRLISATDDPVELQKSYTLAEALKFFYPESWVTHYPDFRDPRNISIQLHNEPTSKKIDGLIRFVAVKRGPQTTLAKEIDKLKHYFDEFLKIEFKKMSSSDKAAVYNRFLFSRYEIYQVESKKKSTSNQELRFVVLGDKDWYIFMFLLTPSEAANLPVWARNIQTFDLIVKSLR